MGDLQQATITIESVTSKDNRVSIKTKEGSSYSFFKTKQDGSETVASKQFTDMGLTDGTKVDIAYDTTTGPNRSGGITTYKNIKSFREPSVQVGETKNSTPKEVTRKPNEIAWGMCKHAFLVEAYKKDKPLTQALDEAEKWADASMKQKEINVSEILS